MAKRDCNLVVATDYAHYLEMKDWGKECISGDVVLRQPPRKTTQRIADVTLKTPPNPDNWTLKVVTDVEHGGRFSALLFNHDFLGNTACFRFDGDGDVHTNPFREGVPLLKRRISTPHFHMYDENGVEIAYKTDALATNELKIMGDRSRTLMHFCEEEHIVVRDGCNVVYEELIVAPAGSVEDPLKGIDFDE